MRRELISLELTVFNALTRFRQLLRSKGPAQRELLWLAFALVIGIVAMPWLTWFVGRISLGPYGNGGGFALWRDYLRGLGQAAQANWILLLGPYVLLSGLRLFRAFWRRSRVEV